MGLVFKWFKDYKISYVGEKYQAFGFNYCEQYSIEYTDYDSVSHTYGSALLVRNFFENCIGIPFPMLPDEEQIESIDYKLNLINPSDMSQYCEKISKSIDIDMIHMRDRFKWFKELSDQGYYIAYNRG